MIRLFYCNNQDEKTSLHNLVILVLYYYVFNQENVTCQLITNQTVAYVVYAAAAYQTPPECMRN
jgi:hypothetical protein